MARLAEPASYDETFVHALCGIDPACQVGLGIILCGVGVVINSLVGDLMHASWRCVGDFGRFVEVGKGCLTRVNLTCRFSLAAELSRLLIIRRCCFIIITTEKHTSVLLVLDSLSTLAVANGLTKHGRRDSLHVPVRKDQTCAYHRIWC